MENDGLQEWRVLYSRGEVPQKISDFMYQCFQIYEIRAKVGAAKGISFYVRTRETNHVLPHIHASYDKYFISIEIETGKILDGNLPKKQQKFAVEWVKNHKQDLLGIWNNIAVTAVSNLTKSKMDMIFE